MTTQYVQEPFYFGGRVRAVGEPIEVENDADRKSLRDRKMIGDDKPPRESPENKVVPGAPETKAPHPAGGRRKG